jgi:peptide/nickel transport system ATP-binding protein
MAYEQRLLHASEVRIHRLAGNEVKTILSGVDLEVDRGETVGIVGESGSGKSMLAKAVMRLLPRGVSASGRIVFRDTDLGALSDRQMERLRGSGISLVFQDPFTMLNPLLRVGDHIVEGLMLGEKRRRRRSNYWEEAVRRLEEVGIPDADVARRYPFQLSGGMRQRVALAAALARDPDLLIADEPSTALDVTTQAQILALLKSLQEARGMGLILITHDLRVAFSVCSRVYVLYAGTIVESAPAADLESDPLHPYSLGLLTSDPPVTRTLAHLPVIEGGVPAPDDVISMCVFSPRCRWSLEKCVAGRPELRDVGPKRRSACIRIDEIHDELRVKLAELLAERESTVTEDAQERPLVRVTNLAKVFSGRSSKDVHALRGVSISIGHNESVGLVGESGSGKTTLARCLVGLERPTSGTMFVEDVGECGPATGFRWPRNLHKIVQIVFQDPYSSLDPKQSAGSALAEVLRSNGFDRRRITARVHELLAQVGLPQSYDRRLPSTLSGGERQRVAIARALAVEPRVIVFDEPVSALDVSVQAQVLNLLADLRTQLGLSYLFITHDLAVVRQVVERVYVCYQGSIVEEGRIEDVLERPAHEYTSRLIASIPGGRDSSEARNDGGWPTKEGQDLSSWQSHSVSATEVQG